MPRSRRASLVCAIWWYGGLLQNGHIFGGQAGHANEREILSPEETVAEELLRRHSERALLIEARTGVDGRVRLLAVFDLDGEALAAEAKRHEARREVGLAVEVIDRPTWLAMRRLTASGMITLTEGRSCVLHQASDFAAAADPSFDPEKRAAELRGEAERSLRMARVLAAGGFPEEALPLTAKAIGISAAARQES